MLSPEPTVDLCQRIDPRPGWECCIVVACGPSLTDEAAVLCYEAQAAGSYRVFAVNDAWCMVPSADALYACDAAWWHHHRGCESFAGEKWSSHARSGPGRANDKKGVAARYGINLVEGRWAEGFSMDPRFIHYGSNSGFQAVNLAMLFGARRIVLVAFDMRNERGRRHFFGDHPRGLRNTTNYDRFIAAFERAAAALPAGVEIVNATPESALRCFPRVQLERELQ